jgi:beta-mannanase
VWTGQPWEVGNLDSFVATTGRNAGFYSTYQDWAHRPWYNSDLEQIANRGASHMITWEPRDYTGGMSQPAYSLQAIAAGAHDAFIREWARGAAAWGRPFYLRFMHEMNGDWYPWGRGVNGNTPADSIAAWRHVHDVVVSEGATNVRWVWSPNVMYGSNYPFADMYPGDAYVDWVALDGYNWGGVRSWMGWQDLTSIFGPSYDLLTQIAPSKPVMIAETASTELSGDKAAWIRQAFFEQLPTRFPRVSAVIWFSLSSETDWRIDSSAASLNAFLQVLNHPSFQGRLP